MNPNVWVIHLILIKACIKKRIKIFFIYTLNKSRWIYHQSCLYVNSIYKKPFYLFHSDDHFLVYIRLNMYIYLRDMQHKELLNTGDCTYKVGLEVHLLLNNEFIDPLHSRTEQSFLLIFSSMVSNKTPNLYLLDAMWCQKHW